MDSKTEARRSSFWKKKMWLIVIKFKEHELTKTKLPQTHKKKQ